MCELTVRQKMFADEYIKTGNATRSYLKIYKCKTSAADGNAARLIVNDSIKKYIEERNAIIAQSKIADMAEIKEFWTTITRDKKQEIRDRLKASELIAKTNAAFISKIQHSVDPVIFEGEDELED